MAAEKVHYRACNLCEAICGIEIRQGQSAIGSGSRQKSESVGSGSRQLAAEEPERRNPKLETRNPELETRNAELET